LSKQCTVKEFPTVIVKVASSLNTSMQIPSDGVLNPWFNGNYANWADPLFSGLRVCTVGLLNLKLHTALYFRVWQ
jgi:hypothetical protein